MKLRLLNDTTFYNSEQKPGEKSIYKLPGDADLIIAYLNGLSAQDLGAFKQCTAVAGWIAEGKLQAGSGMKRTREDNSTTAGTPNVQQEEIVEPATKKQKQGLTIKFPEGHKEGHLLHIPQREKHSTFKSKTALEKAKKAIRVYVNLNEPAKSLEGRPVDVEVGEVIGFQSGVLGVTQKYPQTKRCRFYFNINGKGEYTVTSMHPCEPYDQGGFSGEVTELVYPSGQQKKTTIRGGT